MEKSEHPFPSEDKINLWKTQHGEIFSIVVDDENAKLKRTAILRKPKLIDLERAQSSDKTKPGSFNRSLWVNCILDCDPAICEENTELMLAAYSQLSDTIKVANATIKKL
jgi:hypothetical protein